MKISGSSHPIERTGDGPGQCDVHVQSDGLSSLCLLGRCWLLTPLHGDFYSQNLQSVISEGAPFLLIALVCLLASIPGKKKCSILRVKGGMVTSWWFGSSGLYLPETAGVNLADTLNEIKTFGKWVERLKYVSWNRIDWLLPRNDRFFWMPIFGEDKRKKKAMPVNTLWMQTMIKCNKSEWKIVQ